MSTKISEEAKTNTARGTVYKTIMALVVIAAIAISSYFYIQYRNAQKLLQNPTLAASEETKSLISRVSALIELPKGEDPTIATVSDKNKLADQPFFAQAQNGDKVLIYAKAKKAILYRPAINKIIEVAPVNTTASASTPTSAPVQKMTRVAIYNGTKTVGLASLYEKQLTDKITNVEIVSKDNAKGSYSSTLVVDLTGGNSDLAKQIASTLNGTMGVLPKIEVKPDADILVILGK